jgi:PTS system mannose-specific IIA component
MAGILIIAHAPFATALRDCLTHIYCGLPARVGVIDVMADSDPAELTRLARAEVERLAEENGTLVLTDLFGATPANIAVNLAAMPAVRVLAGVNLPMLVRAVCYRATPLDTLVDKAMAGAANGIRAINADSIPPASLAAMPCVAPGDCAESARTDTSCSSVEPLHSSALDSPCAALAAADLELASESSRPSSATRPSEHHAATRNHHR